MGIDLDLSDVQAQGEPVPTGVYEVVIDKAEVKDTSTGGEMIKIQMKVKGGDHDGRVIFDQFNIKNANPQAVQIGLGQLKGMMKAFGHANPNRLESVTELQGLRGIVNVKVEEQDGYRPQARVKAYKVLAQNASSGGTTGAPTVSVAGPTNPF